MLFVQRATKLDPICIQFSLKIIINKIGKIDEYIKMGINKNGQTY